MKVKITITEKLVRTISVTSNSVEEAKEKVNNMYRSGDIVLTAHDFVGYTITKA